MLRSSTLTGTGRCFVACTTALLLCGGTGTAQRVAPGYGKLPLSFEPNHGQTDARVQWVARGPEYALFLSGHDAVLELNSITPAKGITGRPKIDSAAVRMNLLGARTGKDTQGEEPQPGKANYFTGRNASKWLPEVPMFGKVRLRDVYPGIDLVYYGRQGRLEYDFVVSPGADPATIGLQFDGAKAALAANGDLVLPITGKTWDGTKEIRFDKPSVYQMKNGTRQQVAGAFRVGSDGNVSFALGGYDKTRELVIDPTLIFEGEIATGNQQTIPQGMAVDTLGEMVITGYTNDLTFPVTTGAYQTACSSPTDQLVVEGGVRCGASSSPSAFVTKLSADGTTLIYSTYLHGGGGAEQGQSVAVDAAGDAYVLGSTSSNDFPVTSNAYQSTCQPLALGQNGAPVSQCDNFANGGGTEYTVNGPNLFIAELNPQGTALVYSTFFGGSASVYPVGIALDSAGNMIFASEVNQAESPQNLYPNNNQLPFPTTETGYQTTGIQVQTPALSKLSADGQTLMYSTFLGSQTLNVGHDSFNQAMTLGQNGIAFIGGFTQTSDFPTTAGSVKPTCTLYANDHSYCQTNMGFVAAIDTTKSGTASLVYASYLGGETTQGSNIPEQEVYGLAADANNDLFVTGYTYAANFPTTTGAFQASCAMQGASGNCTETAFLSKINPAGSALAWSTFVGGTSTNPAPTYGTSIALDTAGKVYLYGLSQDGGGDFPQVTPLQPYTSGNKVFLTTFSADGTTLLFGTRFGSSSTTAISGSTPIANGLAVDATGNMYITGYVNDNGTFGTTPGTYSTPATAGFNRTFFAKISPATPPSSLNGLTGNLLLNPGAELGSIADWTAGGDGTPTVDTGTFDSGINPHTGKYDFLGLNGDSDSLSQTVSILSQGITASLVDVGNLYATLSFWEQGLNQAAVSDDASITLTFLNSGNTSLGSVNSGEVDSHNLTWQNFTSSYPIPVGTRSITYTMNFIRHAGSDLDAFVDDNSLSISTSAGLILSPQTVNFGNVAVGSTTAAQVVTVTNSSPITVNLADIQSELGANPADFVQTNNCPAALVQNASCQVSITFTPDGVGAKSAGIAIDDDSVPAQQFIAVTGVGTGGILQVNPGNLKAIAGDGVLGYTGDGGLASAAELMQPNGIAFDPSGNLYIADSISNVVRKVDATGVITTFAGNGTAGYTGDSGPATAAELFQPFSVTSDPAGNIYISDTGNNVIRKVTTATGNISTFAGTGTAGHAGDGGPAIAAKFNQPQGARFDSAGNLYVPQCLGSSVRKIDTAGNISTVAGNFTAGYSGDGGQATAAQLQCPSGVTIDPAGNLYIADEFNYVIRKVNPQGVISTVAGTASTPGFSGDGGPATAAKFNLPNDLVLDPAGNLYVADSANNRVRKIDTTGVITTIAGGLNNAGSAAVNTPLALTLDPTSNVYFSDSGNGKVEEFFPMGTTPFPSTPVGTAATPQILTLSNIGNAPVTVGSVFTLSGNTNDFSLSGGTCLAGATLTASGDSCTLQVSFTPIAPGIRTLTVSIADDALNAPQSFSIGGVGTAAAAVAPTLTWNPPASIVYGTPLGADQLDAVATGPGGVAVPGTFVYSPDTGTILFAGPNTLSVTFTPTDTTAYTVATSTVPITVTQAPPTITWPTPAPITTTTPLSATQLDATALDIHGNPIAGAYVYSPAAGTTLSAGTQTLSVTFTPMDAPNYTTATQTVPILVTQAGTATATTTTLAITSGGSPVTTVTAGSVVTLTATVLAGTAPIALGQVAFCDATATTCTDIHLLAAAQLTTAGTATYKFVPGIGAHSYKAVFLGAVTLQSALRPGPPGANLHAAAVADFQGGQTFGASASPATPLTVTGTYPTTTTIAQSGNPGNYTLTATTVGINPPGTAPTGTVSFLDTSNANASLGSNALGASTPGFTMAQATGSPNAVGGGAYGVATADFNNDGLADVVVENYNAGTVSVLLGNGDGTFQPQVTYSVGAEPERVLVADMNGDGNLDIIVANTASSTISILLGNGDGTFQDQVTYPCGSPVGLGVMDLNHDGIPDIVAGDYYNGTISVLLGNPDGTLQPAVTYATGSTPQTVAEGDFNGDGNVDVVVGNEGGATVGVFLGNGDGTFQAMVTYPVGNSPQGVQVGDFNADGKPDLAVSNQVDGTVSVLLGNGDGTFQTQVTYPVGVQPVGIAIADFNGDGIEDITVGNTGAASLNQGVLLGNGDGTFQPQLTFPTGNFPYGVAVADFNGDGLPDIVASNFNDSTATILLSQPTETATATVTGIAPQGSGTHQVVASYPGDAHYSASVSQPTSLTVAAAATTPIITWTPTVATIVYGTPLGASQLDATAATAAGVAVPGTFAYTPASGTVLGAGPQTLTAIFTPTDTTSFTTATATTTITVTQATPTLTWPVPASIAYGIPLSATQLDASATGVVAGALPGTFTYTPALGTVLNPGTQTLSVTFTPTDTIDYTAATATTNLVVTSVALNAITPAIGPLGAGDTTITLTGSGFVSTSSVRINGTPAATTYVSPTSLTAIIPAADLAQAGTLQITVYDPSIEATSAAVALPVAPVSPAVTLSGPSTTPPGSQPSVSLTITNPYPLDLTATFTLTFAPAGTTTVDGLPVDDPAVQFADGGRTFTINVPANSTVVPPIQLQSGTDAGTITVTAALTSDGTDVTPTTLTPVVITIPAVVPTITSSTVTRSAGQLTVVLHGFSNTREVSQAVFHFTAASGDTISTPDVTIPATTLFGDWFGSTGSLAYGSTFTYTQIFNVSDDATSVATVGVTLTNSVGTSTQATSQ